MVIKPGIATLVTQIFVDAPDALADDVVFGVARDLVAKPELRGEGAEQVLELGVNLVVRPGESRVPLPPITSGAPL
jgi:hypothetical protein